jgi:hypothetical protein
MTVPAALQAGNKDQLIKTIFFDNIRILYAWTDQLLIKIDTNSHRLPFWPSDRKAAFHHSL